MKMAPTKEYALLCLENPLLGMSPNQLKHFVALEMRMQHRDPNRL
jgi:hypothetical protein